MLDTKYYTLSHIYICIYMYIYIYKYVLCCMLHVICSPYYPIISMDVHPVSLGISATSSVSAAVRGSLDGGGDGNIGRQVGAIDFEFTPNLSRLVVEPPLWKIWKSVEMTRNPMQHKKCSKPQPVRSRSRSNGHTTLTPKLQSQIWYVTGHWNW